ncbi:hypothetical protein G3M48_001872 [Beauveria asiatica]|uniref:DUF1275 domain protein n=1 Tax=Beauveria asiatica TaxID=1069075 RepID=A0AAW0RFN7_9HYPO
MAGYGTAASRPADNGHAPPRHGSDPERQSLLGKPHSSPGGPGVANIRKTLNAHVSRSWADLVLLFCYVITGLLDSASTQVWGAFVSMQTGNTVYVALGLASIIYPPINPRLYRSGVSLLAFCVGSFLFARFHRRFSPSRRWVLCASFAAQSLLTVAAALVVALNRPPAGDDDVSWTVLAPLALVAFQSCGQAVTSRALRYNALSSVVLTSIYCDLFSDQDLFRRDNVDRNRRAAAPLMLLMGAVLGGIFAHAPVGIQGALWTAAALKLSMAVIWFFWPAEPEEDQE